MNQDLLNKIQKLLNLSERGIGGEKDNAKKMLEKFMKKNNISFDDLNDTNKEIKFFKYKNDFECRLIVQVIATVLDSQTHDLYRHLKIKKCIGCKVTKEEFIDINLRFQIYCKRLNEGFCDYYTAFLIKNHIYPASMKPSKPKEDQIESLMRAEILASGIDKAQIFKAIECQKR